MQEHLRIAMFGHKRMPSHEGGIEIVVEELAVRMVRMGHEVTCYNRKGHHVSGKQFDEERLSEYRRRAAERTPTLDKKGCGADVQLCGKHPDCVWQVRRGTYPCGGTRRLFAGFPIGWASV